MLLDVSPLVRHRDFRLVFLGQLVSAFGTFLTYVALPVQLYELTRSSAVVGLLGTAQLVPLAVTALWGGAVADAFDRRRLLLWCEALLLVAALLLAGNALRPHPSVALVFVLAAFMSGVSGFHRPSLESLTPQLVDRADLPSVSALRSLHSVAAIAGPTLASLCIAKLGMASAFVLDALTFGVSLGALAAIRGLPPANAAERVSVASITAGLRYAASRPELLGTYAVDIVAMTFATPLALFPALGEQWKSPDAAGYLFTAMSAGALLVTVFSGWTKGVQRHGAAVILAAAAWGLTIVALGHAPSLPVALGCLALAGAADMVSGLFRMTIWNETIPTEIRGRMAGIEQLSYMTGPLLGNARAGFMAERFGLSSAIGWGGWICVICVVACIPLLPAFWRYRAARAV